MQVATLAGTSVMINTQKGSPAGCVDAATGLAVTSAQLIKAPFPAAWSTTNTAAQVRHNWSGSTD